METVLGKIVKAELGFGGYQESQLGLFVELSFNKCSFVCDFITGGYKESIQVTEFSKWIEEDRSKDRIDFLKKLDNILESANIQYVSELVNVPVEMTFEGLLLKNWRVLTEVI